MPPIKSPKVDEYIEAIADRNIQDITNRLRQLIFETDEQFIEEIKWNMPVYRIDKNNVCYLQASKKHVNLGFYAGASLTDRDNLLEGTGKLMRHIRVKHIGDIQSDQFKALIQEAIALGD